MSSTPNKMQNKAPPQTHSTPQPDSSADCRYKNVRQVCVTASTGEMCVFLQIRAVIDCLPPSVCSVRAHVRRGEGSSLNSALSVRFVCVPSEFVCVEENGQHHIQEKTQNPRDIPGNKYTSCSVWKQLFTQHCTWKKFRTSIQVSQS